MHNLATSVLYMYHLFFNFKFCSMAQSIDTIVVQSMHFLKGKRAGQSSLVGFTRGEGLCDLMAHYCWKAGPCDLTARINAPTT